MPYIYSSVRQCYDDMLPLNRGLYIEHPETEEAYKHSGEFYFGDLILGAPVTEPGKGEDKTVVQKVWFPEGANWYSLFDGKKYEGGQTLEVVSTLETSPVFVKGGYPLPMQPYRERMASAPLDTLVVRCYPGEKGIENHYTLYEDDGQTLDYQAGRLQRRIFHTRIRETSWLSVWPVQKVLTKASRGNALTLLNCRA